ncbi:hypothetical protein BOX15_Mlig033858g2 [Macrostomum lignano]|uniref:Uncharacterized protein n=2 Tax=Macrostomum lignano TaxID=282301 RepID=A0A267G7X8_9PLAT|nr:hypothetical protein BOX15_Mlig033858g1 [Macrostomum lignano]PAA82128.1 hypothetical protein BOX15_Mlig033858g2 [Macrostomum lignano]
MSQYRHGLCGCFDDCGICIVAYFLPCYTHGKTAEAVGDSCVLCAIGYLFVAPCVGAVIRGKVRDKQGIAGGFVGDFFTYLCCPLCALVQDAQEVKDMVPPSAQSLERE